MMPPIERVLPHVGRILLLDEVMEYGDEHIVTALTIRDDSVLCEPGLGVPAWVGMEYMAQTACALSGVLEYLNGRPAPISLLLGTRAYRAVRPYFPIGARLRISGRLVVRDEDDLVVFDCHIHDGEEVVASGDIKAIRPANIHKLIEEQLHG